MERKIVIKGARQHNLKNIDVEIPKDKLVVITGLSGSGKSSLAFDTVFAEGQRRYLESLSSYARQFMEQMDKPDVDSVEGLSPAISIEQKSVSKNPRSTVGTITEIYDYLRVLFARIGVPYCYNCGKKIEPKTIDSMVESVYSNKAGEKLIVLSPIAINRKGEFKAKFDDYLKHGFYRIYADGKEYNLDEPINLDKKKKHNIDLVIDRLIIKEENKKRLFDSIELALKLSSGILKLKYEDREEILTENSICLECNISYGKPEPAVFSFNSPQGACPECGGLGYKEYFDEDLIVPDKNLSLNEDAIIIFKNSTPVYKSQIFNSLSKHYGFNLYTPYKDLSADIKQALLYGSGEEKIKFFDAGGGASYHLRHWEGIIPMLERNIAEGNYLLDPNKFRSEKVCPECGGFRLKKESLSYKIGGLNIAEISDLSIKNALDFFNKLELSNYEIEIAAKILNEVKERLRFLVNVGLEYLTLSRQAQTLSGGESQRIRLASQIGSGLTGVLYVMDEPSIGLHMRDNERLLKTIFDLRDKGNSLIVVEHDETTMLKSDYIIDMGPGAGKNGGYVIAHGTPEEIMKNPDSLTGKYLTGQLKIPIPEFRREHLSGYLEIKGAKMNNLKNIDVKIPLNNFVCITGVSGSGKSTLILDTLYQAVFAYKNGYTADFKRFKVDDIKNVNYFDRVVNIDQSPIGRTPRSNPATYTGIFTLIREIFAGIKESKSRGYDPGRFSFNVKGGRCEACSGDGVKKIEMLFMPDVYVMCDICKGKRYNAPTLEIIYKNKNIYDVLNMTVKEAYDFFNAIPPLAHKLKFLIDVGLDYINLGQLATTLSGGEAQRIKLSKELSRPGQYKTLYILDEPTTGLHFDDIGKLLTILNLLVEAGNTVIVIEHNLDIIKSADYIIDMGPEGGEGGGRIIAAGTPEDMAHNDGSSVGKYLFNPIFQR
ncbi:MAG: excinuclease ABC subunit UvrA [Deltaproteobacteria bacterium]|nr:excinuclease ABC subunit UvrA [Deltaproteobacteria bacterium]MCL6120595.1 excinuclease ABC subunit UvrA [Deltaproteobacteria bacterium]